MGMEVRLPRTDLAWTDLQARSAARGLSLQMRMIDGELAFPDEEPGSAWRELRLAVPGGMVTLRREEDGLRLVTWGNADGDLLASFRALEDLLAAP